MTNKSSSNFPILGPVFITILLFSIIIIILCYLFGTGIDPLDESGVRKRIKAANEASRSRYGE